MIGSIFSKDHKAVVEKLRNARREAGLSQAFVAGALMVSQSEISKIEAGQRKIDVVMLRRFANVYDQKVESFLRHE